MKTRPSPKLFPNLGITQYSYDDADRVVSLIDPNQNVTSYDFDGDGNLFHETRADGAKWTYTYDENNNRQSLTDANGTAVTFAYDDADRLTGKSIQKAANVLGPATVGMTLDDLGRTVASSTDEGVSENFAFDSLDRQLREDIQIGSGPKRRVSKAFDVAGNPTGLAYPSDLALNQSFDALNRISAINVAGSQASIVSYSDVGGRLAGKSLLNGVFETWSYDPNRRISEILNKTNSATLRDVQYQRSPIGNKLAIVRPDLAKQATYTFNPNSWITNESLGIPLNVQDAQPSVKTDYYPDKALNYTAIVRNGVQTDTSLNSRNQYTSFGGESLSYDRNGNLTSRSGFTLQYDADNHVKRVTKGDGTVVENLYDAQGRKVEEKTTVGSTTKVTDYSLNGDQAVEEYVNGSIASRYVHGRGIDEIVRAEISSQADGVLDQTLYPIQDELGNVERLTDENGATAERYEYEGYGKFSIFAPDDSPRFSSSFGWNWLFQGREYQPTLAAYDFRARHLWPDLGRFGQEDPAREDDAYSAAAALHAAWGNMVDPFGLLTVIVHGTFAAGDPDFLPGGDFFEEIARTINDKSVISYQWSGEDKHTARMTAGLRLADLVRRHHFTKDEQLNFVAHSHGGNVAIWALNAGLGRAVDNFVTLGTPSRAEYRLHEPIRVKNWVNMVNKFDMVQLKLGGGEITGHAEIGPAARTHPYSTTYWWNVNLGPFNSHHEMHSPLVWLDALQHLAIPSEPPKVIQRGRWFE